MIKDVNEYDTISKNSCLANLAKIIIRRKKGFKASPLVLSM
jgi:hypothetical protein